jgi:tellurite resistance protein
VVTAPRFAAADPEVSTDAIARALETLTIAGLLVRTLVGIARGELRALSA